jgi:hypothetical protein
LVCAVVEITGLASVAVISNVEPRHAFSTCGSSRVAIDAIAEVSTRGTNPNRSVKVEVGIAVDAVGGSRISV